VHGRILPSVKFKRESTKLLSLSELTNLRKNNEVEVSKGKVPLFGRSMNHRSMNGDRGWGIIVENEGESNGRASSRLAIH
jgi:hypothetical protein